MPTVSNYTALLAINDLQAARWNGVTSVGAPVIVTYSFADGGNVPTIGESAFFVTGTSAFTSAQRHNFRDVTKEFMKAAGIIFVEIEEGGMIDLSNAHGSNWGGWADYAWSSPSFTTPSQLIIDDSGNYNEGSFGFEVMMHELGHAMGLQHPHEGSVTLNPSLDNRTHTIMTYNQAGANASVLGNLDKQALQHLYGTKVFRSENWDTTYHEAEEYLFTITRPRNICSSGGIGATTLFLASTAKTRLRAAAVTTPFLAGNTLILFTVT